jgi:hypothetical protein
VERRTAQKLLTSLLRRRGECSRTLEQGKGTGTQDTREVRVGPSRQVSREWIGRRVELSLRGESGTTTGQLLSVGEEGIELSEEIQDEPYGEGAVSEGAPRFYPHESIVAAVLVS